MKFIHPDRLKPELIAEMTAYESYLAEKFPGSSVVVHEDFAGDGHVPDSEHYIGEACDFHVTGVSPLDAWLALERFKFGGIGYYPLWHPVPGFHADVRKDPVRARWARVENDAYVAMDRKIIAGMVTA